MPTSPKQMIFNTLADIEVNGATADIRSTATGTKHLQSGDAMEFLMKALQQEDSLVSRKHLAMLKSTILVASLFA